MRRVILFTVLLTALEREIYHIGDVASDIKVLCENVIIKDDVTYFFEC